MHKSQVFGYLLIFFLLGVFIGAWFNNIIFATLIFVLLGTIILVGAGYERTFAKTKKAERNRRIGMIIGACVLAAALGMFRYGQVNLTRGVLESFADVQAGGKGISVKLRGVVDNEMSTSGRSASGGTSGQFILHVYELIVPGRSMKVDERTILYTKSYPIYRIGDKISVTGSLERPKNFTDDFDYVQYLKNKDVRTTIPYPVIVSDPDINVPWLGRLKLAVYRPLFSIKNKFQTSLHQSLPEPYAAYTDGVLLGTRQSLPEDVKEAFNRTSTTHILAISGYNIAIIAEVLLGVLVFWIRRRRAFWVSVCVIILFTIMTGAGASVVRAAVMGLLLLYANGYGRLYDPKNSILLAATIMVFLDPLSLRFDVGFQLSFLAVFGLLYLYPILEEKFKKVPAMKGLKETFLMSLSAQIMVAPLLAYIFHTFSLVSLPANVLILPFMPYVMLFGFLTGLGGLILAPLGQAVGLITWIIEYYQLHVIAWISKLSFASVTLSLPVVMLLAIYALIVVGIWKSHLLKSRHESNI